MITKPNPKIRVGKIIVKYSNGGCSGFEPDFLKIYSVNNFSNRIFLIDILNLFHFNIQFNISQIQII